jgi:hypothetical protein
VLEVRQGRRLITEDPSGLQAPCALTTPTLTMLEWALASEKLALSTAALAKMQGMAEAPADVPSPASRPCAQGWQVAQPPRRIAT